MTEEAPWTQIARSKLQLSTLAVGKKGFSGKKNENGAWLWVHRAGSVAELKSLITGSDAWMKSHKTSSGAWLWPNRGGIS